MSSESNVGEQIWRRPFPLKGRYGGPATCVVVHYEDGDREQRGHEVLPIINAALSTREPSDENAQLRSHIEVLRGACRVCNDVLYKMGLDEKGTSRSTLLIALEQTKGTQCPRSNHPSPNLSRGAVTSGRPTRRNGR